MPVRTAVVLLWLALFGLTPIVCPAQALFSVAQKHDPQAQAHRDMGDKLFAAQDFPGAIREYQAASTLDKNKPAYSQDREIDLRKIGNIYLIQSQYSQAINFYQQALSIAQQTKDTAGQAIALYSVGYAYYASRQYDKAIDFFQRAVPLCQKIKDIRGQAFTLYYVGNAYTDLRQYEKAITYYQQALSSFQQIQDQKGQADDLNTLGSAYNSLSQYGKAITYLQQALTIFQQIKDQKGQASDLTNLGIAYDELSQFDKAIDCYQQALPIFQQTKDRDGEADDLNNLGNVEEALNQYDKAIDYFQQALLIFQQNKDQHGQAVDLTNLGRAYVHLSQYDKAITYLQQARIIFQQIKDQYGDAFVLTKIGIAYDELSQYEKAIGYYQQALTIFQQIKDQKGQASNLTNLGLAYIHLSQYDKAIDCLQQALTIHPPSKDPGGAADDLNNLGIAYLDLSQYDKAINYFQQALPIFQEINDIDGQASALTNLGNAYDYLGQYDKAVDAFQQALPLFQQTKDRDGEAKDLGSLMVVWQEQKRLSLATFYGKQSVNIYQSIRQNIQTMDKDTQKTYLKAKEPLYRSLAKLLIGQGRLPEAIQILDMLKQEEYLNFTENTHEGTALLAEQAQMTPPEITWNTQYQQSANLLESLEQQRQTLQAKKNRTPEETTQLQALDTQSTEARQKIDGVLAQIQTEAGKGDAKDDRLDAQADATRLQTTLGTLSHHSVAVYTLAGDKDVTLLLVTPTKITTYSSPIAKDELGKKVNAFRAALQDPTVDPRLVGKELYDLLVKPMEADLKAAHDRTLMWSLDGSLRYIPIAALYDGQRYMVEKYTNTLFSPASNTQLTADPQPHWTGLGLGVSQQHPGFLALTNVPAELDSVIHDPQVADSQNGAMPGTILLDGQFTQAAFITSLARHDPLVHIASHFAFQPGNAKDSFLLLGDGSHLSLADIQAMPDDLLSGVNLLTLSACQTAADGVGANGKEVENLAVLAQRKGAQAVMASLWSVDDAATQQLMHDFYDDRQSGDGMSKGDALRQAQLSILGDASLAQATAARGARAEIVPDKKDKTANLRPYHFDPAHPQVHPYFWAPFILIGNWK